MADSTRRFHCPKNPHFFQPLIPGFENNFSIPKSFHKYIEIAGEDVMQDDNGTAILLRDRTEKNWRVKVAARRDDGRLDLKDGWEEFCKDHDLHVGDFLVFRLQGNLVFDVSIFDPTGCEHEFPVSDGDSQGRTEASGLKVPRNVIVIALSASRGLEPKRRAKKHPKNRDAFKRRGCPYFQTVIKRYNVNCGAMCIPVEFARETGLAERESKLVLIDARGRSWSMLLRQRKGDNGTYIGGWQRFHKANDLNIGDSVIFELIRSGRKPVMEVYTCIS